MSSTQHLCICIYTTHLCVCICIYTIHLCVCICIYITHLCVCICTYTTHLCVCICIYTILYPHNENITSRLPFNFPTSASYVIFTMFFPKKSYLRSILYKQYKQFIVLLTWEFWKVTKFPFKYIYILFLKISLYIFKSNS